MRKSVLLLAVLFALTACGGGSAAPKTAAAKSSSPTFAIAVTPKSVADELGCGDSYADDTTEEIYVQAVGTCDFKTYGKTRILTFANDQARDSFVTAAESFGGQYIKGHDYAIEYPG